MRVILRSVGIGTAALLVSIGIVARVLVAPVEDAAEDSERLAMLDVLAGHLNAFARIKDSYPSSLDQLTITEFPDGSSMKTVREFSYQSDGQSYSLGIETKYRGYVSQAYSRKGDFGPNRVLAADAQKDARR